MIQAFYSKLESVLQSSKFDNLKLSDPFTLKIKLLGEQHMKEIRQKQEDILKRLSIPNFGIDEFFKSFEEQPQNIKIEEKKYLFEIPRTFSPNQNYMEDCFKSNCLIFSVIMGRYSHLIQTKITHD